MLANALACYLRQDYPASQRLLLIGDDGATFPAQAGPGWQVLTREQRFPTLGEKYNWLGSVAMECGAEALVVWEDDDIYLPHHLTVHAETLQRSAWCHPRTTYSDYARPKDGSLNTESALGRFHGGWSFRADHFRAIGGYSATARLDFDQQMGRRLSGGRGNWTEPDANGTPGDPSALRGPSYVYRWHGRNASRFGEQQHWWSLAAAGLSTERVEDLKPRMDAQTQAVFARLGIAT